MKIRDLLFEFEPVPVVAIPVREARVCMSCEPNNIVRDRICPVCGRGTFPVSIRKIDPGPRVEERLLNIHERRTTNERRNRCIVTGS